MWQKYNITVEDLTKVRSDYYMSQASYIWATPLTCCVGWRSSGQGPPLIPWGEAHITYISLPYIMFHENVIYFIIMEKIPSPMLYA